MSETIVPYTQEELEEREWEITTVETPISPSRPIYNVEAESVVVGGTYYANIVLPETELGDSNTMYCYTLDILAFIKVPKETTFATIQVKGRVVITPQTDCTFILAEYKKQPLTNLFSAYATYSPLSRTIAVEMYNTQIAIVNIIKPKITRI